MDRSSRQDDLSSAKQALLARLAKGHPAEAASSIPRALGDGPFPLSYPQDRVWFTSQLAPDVRLFNLIAGLRLPGRICIAELERNTARTVQRHDVLRMSVQLVDDEPMLVVAPPVPIEVPVLDRSAASVDGAADVDQLARDTVLEVAGAPFRLDAAPLWRIALVELPDDEQMLVMGAHHLLIDGPSLQMLGYELLASTPPPAPRVRYGDFAVWQQNRAREGGFADELSYWWRQLADLPAPLDLSFGRPRPAQRSLRGATVSADVPDELERRVRELSRDEGVTPYITFLAAFVSLLHRYTGREDVLVGAPVSGRTVPGVANLLGMFVNMVPIRSQLAGHLSFRELLTLTTQTLSDALSRQNLPFELLVKELGVGGPRSHPPLVQIGFNMPVQDVPTELRVVDVPFNVEGSQLDLTVHVQTRGGGGLQVLFEYASDVLDEQRVRRLVEHYFTLLSGLVDDPTRTVGEVSLLPPDERAALLSGRGPAPGDCGHDVLLAAPLHRLVAEQARRTPEAVAVVCGEQSLSYAELDARANGLARGLRGLGVDTESVVGVLLQPCIELPVALLAVWKAGAAYLPMDPEPPAARSTALLADAGVRVLLTQRKLAIGEVAAAAGEVVCLDDPAEPIEPAPDFDSARPAQAGAAYVIYTSGSTGAPKGVVVTHGGITNRVLWTVRAHGIGPADRVLQKTRLSFDAAGWEVFAPLVSGGTVVIAPPGADRDPDAILRAVAQHRVTVLQVVPSVLRLLVDVGDWSGCHSLRLLFSAGEPLYAELCARVRELVPVRIMNTYGPTECAIDVTAAEYDPAQLSGPVPIGRPIHNSRVLVLDPTGEPAPIGVAGELCVGGVGVGRGYLGRPRLTASAFVADPHGAAGGRLYRTGDRVGWRSDGQLEFLGRVDHQVKVNGVRVELAEVESVLASHPWVRAAAVTAPPDGSGGRRLVGYVVGAAVVPAAPEELRAFLRRRLPAAMVPGLLIKLDEMPLTASGKVDLPGLPAPEVLERPAGLAYVAPRNHTEQLIADVWADLLRVDRIGVNDEFFALGGHSLMLTRLAVRLRGTLGVELTVAELFNAPTLADQARLVTAGGGSLQPIRPAARGAPLPLSSGQNRLWFLQQLQPSSTQYNVPVALQLTGELDAAALRAALDQIVARHEVLRTAIALGPDGVAHQVICQPQPVPVAWTDLGDLPPDDARAEAQRLVDTDISTPFDLGSAPMLRAQLIRLDERRHMLGITFHHIASDGWSAGVFRHELALLYAAFRDGRPSPLPPLPVQYADYATWQRGWLSLAGDAEVQRQREYWRAKLAGLPTVTLPTDRPRPAQLSPAGDYCTFRVSAEVTGKLRALSRRAGASPFMTLLAAFKALLARYTGQHDLVVGTSIAGRTHPETEHLIGFFVNTLVLRTDLSGDPTVAELLGRVRDTAVGAFTHQDLPFEHLVEELRPSRDLSRHPLFQIMFEMVVDGPDSPMPGLELEPLCDEMPWRNAKFDLTLEMGEQRDGSLGGYVEYATDLFARATIERMVAHYTAVLTAFAENADAHLSELELLSSDENRQLAHWGAGPSLDAAGALVPQQVAAHAAASPDAVAVVAGGRELSYRELDAEASRLAYLLRSHGVGRESVVGLCLGDGVGFVVAVLAVLKAGGAYLPLDSTHPAERLAFVLEDAGAAVVLTTAAARGHLPADATTTVIALDDPAVRDQLAAASPTSASPARLHPENTAYVIYTSGSTGTPKGVLVSHGALANSTAARLHYYRDPVGTFQLLSPVIFDGSVAGLFWTLCSGGTLLIPDDGRRLADEICGDVAKHRVTHLLAVPSLLGQLAEWHERSGAEPLDSLRVLITAGEAFLPELVSRLAAMAPGAVMFNEYGPTEAAVWASVARLELEVVGTVPIGAPIANAQCHVLDPQLRPVPVGVPGEQYLGGPGLARGYAGQAALTAALFVANPLGGEGSRLYRTGDLVRWRPDGQLEFLGRTDDQLKIDGCRVEPAEVEAALAAHPRVARTVVVDHGQRLVAYLVAADAERPATADELRSHCRARLPGHLVPSHFMQLDALPLAASGKLDRAALPDPDGGRVGAGDGTPLTDTEREVARIWFEVLGVDQVGIHDDFFELGGHSLQAVLISTRLQERYDVQLPLRRLFEATTVAQLAATLEEAIEAEVAALSDAEVEALLAEGHG